MSKCPKCGALYGTSDQFCPECGNPFDEEDEEIKESPIPPYKLLGVFLPLAIIVIAVLIGTFEIGLTEEKYTVPSIPFSQVLNPGDICNANPEIKTLVQTIKIKNNFIVSRLKETPRLMACYYPPNPSRPNYFNAPFYYYVGDKNLGAGQTFEIPARSEKTFEIKIGQRCVAINEYYDEILLIQMDNQNYVDCKSLTQEQINKAARIKLER